MQKGVALIAHIYEAGVESWHQFLDLSQIDVADRESSLTWLALVFHQSFVFEQSYGYLLLSGIDDYFACHSVLSV